MDLITVTVFMKTGAAPFDKVSAVSFGYRGIWRHIHVRIWIGPSPHQGINFISVSVEDFTWTPKLVRILGFGGS